MSYDGRTFQCDFILYLDYFLKLPPSLDYNLQKGKDYINFVPFLSSMMSRVGTE